MSNLPALPDNFVSRISRVYVDSRKFTDDSGKSVEYSRLILEGEIKGETFQLEYKPEKKDLMLLSLADDLDGGAL